MSYILFQETQIVLVHVKHLVNQREYLLFTKIFMRLFPLRNEININRDDGQII